MFIKKIFYYLIAILLLIFIFTVPAYANDFSYDSTNGKLTGPGFEMSISDHWGTTFEIDESVFKITPISGDRLFFAYSFPFDYKIPENALIDLLDTCGNVEGTDVQYTTSRYSDGYMNDSYIIIDNKRCLFEKYAFLTNDNYCVILIATLQYPGADTGAGRVALKNDIETIKYVSSNSSRITVTNTPTPRPTSVQHPNQSSNADSYYDSINGLLGLLGALSEDEIRPSIRTAVESFETCCDNMLSLLNGLTKEEIDIVKQTPEYISLLTNFIAAATEFDALDTDDLNEAEEVYFLQATFRVMQKYYDCIKLIS